MRWRPPVPGQKVEPFPSTKPASVSDESAATDSAPTDSTPDAAAPDTGSANDPQQADLRHQNARPAGSVQGDPRSSDDGPSVSPDDAPSTKRAEATSGDTDDRLHPTDRSEESAQ